MTRAKMNDIGIILLAAGSSARMGRSKQLLTMGSEPLLTRSTKVILEAGFKNVIVVLGSNQKEHEEIIHDLPVVIVYNHDWQKGIGSSIKVGLIHLTRRVPETAAAMITVCDQPLLGAAHLKNIASQYQDKSSRIVCSFYSGVGGVPALFDKSLFPDLLSLKDEQGAKKIIRQFPDITAKVDFPGGEIDLDTMDDYSTFTTKF